MTDLSETIARLEQTHILAPTSPGTTITHALSHQDFTALLSAARRVVAMESATSEAIQHGRRQLQRALDTDQTDARVIRQFLALLLDAAADGAVARERVKELGHMLESQTFVLQPKETP